MSARSGHAVHAWRHGQAGVLRRYGEQTRLVRRAGLRWEAEPAYREVDGGFQSVDHRDAGIPADLTRGSDEGSAAKEDRLGAVAVDAVGYRIGRG